MRLPFNRPDGTIYSFSAIRIPAIKSLVYFQMSLAGQWKFAALSISN
jgi:hypothetical protein